MNFLIGVIIGIVFVTLGVTGVGRMIDKGIISVQETVKEIAK